MNDKWDIILLVINMYGFDIFNISEYLLIIVGLMYFLKWWNNFYYLNVI